MIQINSMCFSYHMAEQFLSPTSTSVQELVLFAKANVATSTNAFGQTKLGFWGFWLLLSWKISWRDGSWTWPSIWRCQEPSLPWWMVSNRVKGRQGVATQTQHFSVGFFYGWAKSWKKLPVFFSSTLGSKVLKNTVSPIGSMVWGLRASAAPTDQLWWPFSDLKAVAVPLAQIENCVQRRERSEAETALRQNISQKGLGNPGELEGGTWSSWTVTACVWKAGGCFDFSSEFRESVGFSKINVRSKPGFPNQLMQNESKWSYFCLVLVATVVPPALNKFSRSCCCSLRWSTCVTGHQSSRNKVRWERLLLRPQPAFWDPRRC